jgi:hypothetical protein
MVTRWGTGQVLARTPAGGVKFTDTLRAGGVLDCSVSVDAPFLSGQPEDDLWRRVLWPCLNGNPMGAYVLTSFKWNSTSGMIELHGDRVDQVLWRRTIRQTLSFTQIDQNDILRDLIRAGMSVATLFTPAPVTQDWPIPSGIPWWTLSTNKSGVLRDRLETPGNTDDGYPAQARKVIGQMVKNLTELGDEPGTTTLPGPEYRLLYRRQDDGTPYVYWDIGYPTVGVERGNQGRKVFEHPGGNVSSVTMAGDGTGMGNRVEVLGAEAAGVRLIGDANTLQNDPVNGLPYLEIVVSDQATDQATLNQKAAGRLAGANRPLLGVDVELVGNRAPVAGTYLLGDSVVLKTRMGRRGLTSRDMRITGLATTVDATGDSEKVVPTLMSL